MPQAAVLLPRYLGDERGAEREADRHAEPVRGRGDRGREHPLALAEPEDGEPAHGRHDEHTRRGVEDLSSHTRHAIVAQRMDMRYSVVCHDAR